MLVQAQLQSEHDTETNPAAAQQSLNILYHHRTQGRGAEGVHISCIVKALEKQGHRVTVVSPPGVDPLATAGHAPVDKSSVKTSGYSSLWKFISNHLPNFLFEIMEIGYNITSLKRLEKELANEHFDFIYERYAFYMISGAIKARKYGIPLVLEANEICGIKDRARKQSFVWLCARFEQFLFKRCTSIHTVSSYLKNRICAAGIAPEKIQVTPNAIDPDKFDGSRNFASLKDKFSINADSTIIGFAGWFDNWDRLDLLVDVFYQLKKNHSDLILLLIGDGAVLSDIREKITALQLQDSVIITGAVSRDVIHQYLSLLDIAVITHSNEFGSPVVMFEFMGLKIPIIAPKLLPITDVLKNAENADLFEILDMAELTSKLDHLISNKPYRQKIAQAAFETLMNKHTWHNNAREIIVSSGIVTSGTVSSGTATSDAATSGTLISDTVTSGIRAKKLQ